MSFAIQSRGHFTWIHILSVVVLVMLVRAVLAIRARNIRLHQRLVIGTYTGLVIAGKQAIDNDMNATGQMLAALLGWGQATFASELKVEGEAATVTRWRRP